MQMGLDGKEKILFYGRKDGYGWMSNFERAPMVIDGIEYQTNEHYYQSQRSHVKALQDWIAAAPNPYAAMKAGRALRPEEETDNWESIKFDVMLKGLRAKYMQNPTLKQKLLDTGDAYIHEDSPTDMVWGIKGKDMLGKLLMQVRKELGG